MSRQREPLLRREEFVAMTTTNNTIAPRLIHDRAQGHHVLGWSPTERTAYAVMQIRTEDSDDGFTYHLLHNAQLVAVFYNLGLAEQHAVQSYMERN